MNLREPKKKRRVKLKPQPPLPILLGEGNEWRMYTAHLTDLGSCIVDPSEISAIHSMGFFGKGSLSRSYPAFGKARYGAPPLVRNRQWVRRQEWVKQINELSAESNFSKQLNEEDCEQDFVESCETPGEQEDQDVESTPDIIEIGTVAISGEKEEAEKAEKEKETDHVVLDSTEEDDMCVIVSKDNEKSSEDGGSPGMEENEKLHDLGEYNPKEDEIFCLNDETDMEGKLLVLPDSDEETEDYLKEIKPKVECQSFPIQETLHLTFEETFFLLYGLGCLNVVHFDGSLLNINSAWIYFCKADKDFVQKYVVYHYFRSKGWVVKPGLKYGGDFLLYKQGPPFYHASYIVIVDVVDADTLVRDPTKTTRSLTWTDLLGLERLSETAAKEILFAQVLWPSSIPRNSNPRSPDALSEFSVKELLWRRWNPKHSRDTIDLEDEDEDSC